METTDISLWELYSENWELYTFFLLALLEVILRKIPTLSNISLVHTFDKVLDFFVKNRAKTPDSVIKHNHYTKEEKIQS